MKEDIMQVVLIGLDLAKYVFEVHGVDAADQPQIVTPYVKSNKNDRSSE